MKVAPTRSNFLVLCSYKQQFGRSCDDHVMLVLTSHAACRKWILEIGNYMELSRSCCTRIAVLIFLDAKVVTIFQTDFKSLNYKPEKKQPGIIAADIFVRYLIDSSWMWIGLMLMKYQETRPQYHSTCDTVNAVKHASNTINVMQWSMIPTRPWASKWKLNLLEVLSRIDTLIWTVTQLLSSWDNNFMAH